MSLAERLPEGGEGPSAALVLDTQRVRAGPSGISGGIVRAPTVSASPCPLT